MNQTTRFKPKLLKATQAIHLRGLDAILAILLFAGVASSCAFSSVTEQIDEMEIISQNSQVSEKEEIPFILSPTGKELSFISPGSQTVLETLQRLGIPITFQGSGVNAFITAINGVEANSASEFWAFYIDGEFAPLGAGSFIAEKGQQITWRLEQFN